MKLTGKQTQFIKKKILPWSVGEDHSTLAALTLIILFSETLKFSPQKKKPQRTKNFLGY
jgi:hypothetical protein